jgi:hypothetical protein
VVQLHCCQALRKLCTFRQDTIGMNEGCNLIHSLMHKQVVQLNCCQALRKLCRQQHQSRQHACRWEVGFGRNRAAEAGGPAPLLPGTAQALHVQTHSCMGALSEQLQCTSRE